MSIDNNNGSNAIAYVMKKKLCEEKSAKAKSKIYNITSITTKMNKTIIDEERGDNFYFSNIILDISKGSNSIAYAITFISQVHKVKHKKRKYDTTSITVKMDFESIPRVVAYKRLKIIIFFKMTSGPVVGYNPWQGRSPKFEPSCLSYNC